MSYGTLMVHLELGVSNAPLLKMTAGLAERLNAKIIGIVACQPMRIIYSDTYVPGEIIEQDRREIDQQIRTAEAEFRAAVDGHIATAAWRSAVIYTPLSEYLANEARCADLIITGVDHNASMFNSSRHVDIGDLVMEAGRPCLIVSQDCQSLPLAHAVVGWKDTSETRRAIRDALPLLRLAGRVTVVEIADEQALSSARGHLNDVVDWLSRHGIVARPLASLATGDDAAQLKTIVGEQGADLVVAGAYGHSRVREWALGGVTRDLLLRSDCCSLLSH